MCRDAAFEREINYTRSCSHVLTSHTAKREACIFVCSLIISSLWNSCTSVEARKSVSIVTSTSMLLLFLTNSGYCASYGYSTSAVTNCVCFTKNWLLAETIRRP